MLNEVFWDRAVVLNFLFPWVVVRQLGARVLSTIGRVSVTEFIMYIIRRALCLCIRLLYHGCFSNTHAMRRSLVVCCGESIHVFAALVYERATRPKTNWCCTYDCYCNTIRVSSGSVVAYGKYCTNGKDISKHVTTKSLWLHGVNSR